MWPKNRIIQQRITVGRVLEKTTEINHEGVCSFTVQTKMKIAIASKKEQFHPIQSDRKGIK